MWKQNVVSRIRILSSALVDQSEILATLYRMVRNDDQAPSLPTSQIDLWLDSIVNGNLILPVVEPSTGAEFIIVSKSMKETTPHD